MRECGIEGRRARGWRGRVWGRGRRGVVCDLVRWVRKAAIRACCPPRRGSSTEPKQGRKRTLRTVSNEGTAEELTEPELGFESQVVALAGPSALERARRGRRQVRSVREHLAGRKEQNKHEISARPKSRGRSNRARAEQRGAALYAIGRLGSFAQGTSHMQRVTCTATP